MPSSSLEMTHRPRSARRSRWWRILAVVGALALAVGWFVWFLRTPEELPVSTNTIEDQGVVDQELYVGMFAVGDGFDRTITISDVRVDVDADGDVEVTPLVCRGGSLRVTPDADPFCSEIVDVDGAEFSGGDAIVLSVSASEPTEVTIGRIEVSFSEGIRSGTTAAGIARATLTFADHTPATIEDAPDSEDSVTERPESVPEKKDDRDRSKEKPDGPPPAGDAG